MFFFGRLRAGANENTERRVGVKEASGRLFVQRTERVCLCAPPDTRHYVLPLITSARLKRSSARLLGCATNGFQFSSLVVGISVFLFFFFFPESWEAPVGGKKKN